MALGANGGETWLSFAGPSNSPASAERSTDGGAVLIDDSFIGSQTTMLFLYPWVLSPVMDSAVALTISKPRTEMPRFVQLGRRPRSGVSPRFPVHLPEHP